MLTLPIRVLLFVVLNLLVAPRNLMRWLRRRPEWVSLKIDGHVAERQPPRRFFRRSHKLSVASLEELCEAVAAEPKVRGLVLEIDAVEAGWARLEAMRTAVLRLRSSGKRVVAHLSSPGNREIYLAAACDEVLVDESGPVGLTGLALERGFYGEALRRLGVDPEIDRIGAWKSFAETFTDGAISPANREALEAILDVIEARLLAALCEGRKIETARARALVDGGPWLADRALAEKLVDAVLYRDEVALRLGDGKRPARIEEASRFLRRRPRFRRLGLGRRRVAVLTLEGTIVPGEGTNLMQRSCGSASAGRALSSLREDERVAAVVLHVDSRGGSSAASDLIWRDVARLAAAKPVVACFGDAAASGGYYIAAPCAWIVAQPATLTGSIGVIAGKLSIERLLERLSIGTAVLTRGKAAAMGSLRRGYDPTERERLRGEIAGVYRQFVEKVAAGRKLTVAKVDEVGQGRVWTGEAAAKRGLVDQIGGVGDAIRAAEERARRKAGERFDVVDVIPRAKAGGLLRSLLRFDLAPELASLKALGRERVLLYADEVPEIE